jgi:ADP-heptose:LPS heptosyltransferase
MLVRTDCRHFLGDRPCRPHKLEGVKCDGCHHYQRKGERILIVKLDAVGDVLRTTCVLDALHEAYPLCHVEWLTMENAAELLDNNRLVAQVHCFPGTALMELLTRRYDIVINLDNSPRSCQLATLAQGRRKLGFGFNPDGHIEPLSDAARVWFEMGLFDDVKRRNKRTYQEIALEVCGLPTQSRDLHLHLSAEERAWARSCAARWGIDVHAPVVGLNTGCGARWPHKKWTEDGYVTLIGMLHEHGGRLEQTPHVLLLGGPEERERNARILERAGHPVVDTGCDHTLRRFCSLVELCDVVVTGDTLALHAAAALRKRVVAIFGPTSVAEIDLYGRGIKLVSDAPCVGGYRTECDERPTCMERIAPQQVFDAVAEMLIAAGHPS